MRAFTCLLTLPILGTSLAPADRLAYAPEEGTRVRVEIVQEFELDMTDSSLTVVVGGQEQPAESPFEDFALVEKERLVFTEETGAIEDGRPTRIERSFEEISSSQSQEVTPAEGEATEEEKDRSSGLEGETVVFTWDAEEEEYRAAFEDEGADAALLEPLEARADFAWLLPEDEVSEGDRWDLDVALFRRVVSPAGELPFEDADESERGRDEQLTENLEGSFVAEHRGTREVGGERVAVIALTVDVETWAEEDEETSDQLGAGSATTRMTLAFELEGELLWLLGAQRAHSLELEGEVRAEIRRDQESETPMGALEVIFVQELEGDYRLAIEVD